MVLFLIYVLFSTRGSSPPEAASSPPVASDSDAKTSEVAESEKATGDKSDATEPESASTPVGAPSLLRHKEKNEKGANGKAADPAAKPGAQKTEDTEASESRTGTLARKKAKSIAKTPFDPKAAVALAGTGRSGSSGTGQVGAVIPAFSSSATDNTTFHSADHKEQVLVVAFLGVECPLANLYAPSLAELAKHYQGKSVAFIAVNSNAQDTLERRAPAGAEQWTHLPRLEGRWQRRGRLVRSRTNAGSVCARCTANRAYRGMLDDQYGYRERRSAPTKKYVANAVDALLKSETVPLAETQVQGCHIGRVDQGVRDGQTSYYRDVLPILQKRCQQCHRKGEIGPFALSDYEVVRNWGPTIRDAVAERRMPPWPADRKIGTFSNDISLSDQEIKAITEWVDDGCPEGDNAEKPPAKQFVDGWNIGKPDRTFNMPETYHVPATGVIEYKNFVVSPVFTKDTWVQAVECRFGNRSVVHHMLVLLDFPKDHARSQNGLTNGFFAAGTPGSTYFTFPKGYAKKIPKGARLRFQMHYTPNGTAGEDLSKFGIVLAKGNSFREVQTFALGKPDILIPAGDADHVEFASQPVPAEITLTTLMPHLHVRGKSFAFFLERPNGQREPLLSLPRWDFNWQYQYELAEPLTIPKGSKLVVEAHWDNSANNPNNIFPLVDATFGEQTFDEMFIGYINAIPAKLVADAGRPVQRQRGPRKASR